MHLPVALLIVSGGVLTLHRSFQPMLAPLTLLCLFLTGCPRSQPRVVLYCAQDREFAEESLAEFTKSTGIKVVPEFDTEADKSVSLYQNLIQEKARPRCDVFWNNEILSTIRLERQGLLEPYASPAAEPYPDRAKAKDHTWHAFANRARVLIVNTQKVPANERPRSLLDLTNERWQGRAVMARPMHGTSATQAACLFEVLGQEKAQEYYRALLANKMEIAPGNKQVAEWVGQGRTPRFSRGRRRHRHRRCPQRSQQRQPGGHHLPGRREKREISAHGHAVHSEHTLRDPRRPEQRRHRKLVDYLLSPEVEARLAESESHQIPLNPNVKAKLPAELEAGRNVRSMDVNFFKAADLWRETQEFLKKEFEQ